MMRGCAFSYASVKTPMKFRGQQQMCRIARDFALSTHGPQTQGTPTALSRRRVSVRSGVNPA
jgi:hypothetical protein